jgi:hypothetical protein
VQVEACRHGIVVILDEVEPDVVGLGLEGDQDIISYSGYFRLPLPSIVPRYFHNLRVERQRQLTFSSLGV